MGTKGERNAYRLRGSPPWPSLYRNALGSTEKERSEIESMLDWLSEIPPLSETDLNKNSRTISEVRRKLERLERYIHWSLLPSREKIKAIIGEYRIGNWASDIPEVFVEPPKQNDHTEVVTEIDILINNDFAEIDQSEDAQAKKDFLDDLTWKIANRFSDKTLFTTELELSENMLEKALEIAAMYLDHPWVQAPESTKLIQTMVVHHVVSQIKLSVGKSVFKGIKLYKSVRTLDNISKEVETGYFDSEELVERLKATENIIYPSILIPLLKLDRKDYSV